MSNGGKIEPCKDRRMSRNRILFVFRLITTIGVATGGEMTEYIEEVSRSNEQRSLLVVYINVSAFESLSEKFYKLELPLYNIYLSDLKTFNGKYNEGYDIRMTYEESKLYFIFLDNLQDIYTVVPLSRKIYFWRDRDKILVIVKGNYSVPDLKATFLFCYQFYIINIALAFVSETIETFSYNPFTRDFFIPMTDPGNLFPDKFRDLYGYELKISLFPSVINTYKKGVYQGADGHISRIVAHHLNASYKYVKPRVTKYAPVINQYDDVAERIADVGFNTRYIKFNFRNLIERTYPHDRDDLACLIPKLDAKKFIGFQSLLSDSIWFLSIGISLFFFFHMIASLLVEGRRLNVVNLVLMILLLLLNKSVAERRTLDFRIALMSYLMFCFFLNTLIVCRLTSIITAPKRFRGIETLKELADTKYKLITIDRFEELLDASLESNLHKKIMPRLSLIQEEDYLKEIRKCQDVVFICKDHLAIYAQIQKENYPDGIQFFHVMKERILPALSCYIVSYGSPFLPRLEGIVNRITQAGIYDYWKMKTWEKLGLLYTFRFNRNSDGHAVAVSLEDIDCAVRILFVGLGSSAVVFVVELLWIRWSKLQIKVGNYAELLF